MKGSICRLSYLFNILFEYIGRGLFDVFNRPACLRFECEQLTMPTVFHLPPVADFYTTRNSSMYEQFAQEGSAQYGMSAALSTVSSGTFSYW